MGSEPSVDDEAKRISRRIGTRIAELRKARGWTQKDLAAKLNCHQQWVSAVEHGQNLTIHTMVRIARTLGASWDDLHVDPTSEQSAADK